jgi:hypothetical protein
MNTILHFVGLFAVAFVGACSAAATEPTDVSARPVEHPLLLAVTTIPGFNQTFSTTKFQTGNGVSTVLEPGGLTKWVGANGIFAIDDIGAASGIMSAGVPFTPYAGGIAAHEALVKSYFLGAGLPEDQVGVMHTNVTASGDGFPGDPEIPKQFAFSSIVTRAVQGIPVDESHAWARLDVDGNVVAEGVYWPPIDASVVADALTLSTTLAAPTSAAGYLATLPLPSSVSGGGTLRIHHSSQFVRGNFTSVACFDVWNPSEGGGGWMRHFDKTGTEIRLPQELRQGTASAKL